MEKLGTIKFSGQSGVRYALTAYPLGTVFEEGLGGVYIVTRRRKNTFKSGFVHRRMGTGRSDDLRLPSADDGQSFAARGANCICVHAEKDDGIRQKIERDLLPPISVGTA